VFVAHRRAKDTLVRLKNPAVVIPDLAVDDSGGALTVGGTRVEMHYVERNTPTTVSWGRYNEFLPLNVERLCLYWRNGWQ
jgi:hypothetical protein